MGSHATLLVRCPTCDDILAFRFSERQQSGYGSHPSFYTFEESIAALDRRFSAFVPRQIRRGLAGQERTCDLCGQAVRLVDRDLKIIPEMLRNHERTT